MVEQLLLARQISPTDGLKVYDDISDLQVPLLLQVGEDSSPEKDLTLADTEQISIQLQGLNLPKTGRDVEGGKKEKGRKNYLFLFCLIIKMKNNILDSFLFQMS